MKTQKLLPYGVLCLAFVLGAARAGGAQPAPPENPNILFVAIDDLNDWVGVLDGHAGMDIKTPNIDRLAASSLLFTNAHTASPACAPSRLALMTGVHPARTRIMRNRGFDDEGVEGAGWRKIDVLQDVETLEQFFKNRGYKTLGPGKIYHTLEAERTPRSQVEAKNWDFYYPSAQINLPNQIRAPERVGRGRWWTWGPIPVEDNKMSDYHIVDWASYQLRQQHDRPLFLATGIFRPHSPWEVPQKYFDKYPLDEVKLPEHKKDDLIDAADHGRRYIHKWVLQNDQWKNVVQIYAASVSFADAMIGKLLIALENSPHADNTIVVLWSDHGMHLGEKANYEKFTLWESATQVPLIFNVPGLTQPGSTINQPVSLLDIYPTLVEAAGFEVPSHVDGTSLVPLIKNQEGARRPPVVTSYRFDDEVGVGHAVRSQDYRYIYYPRIGLEELYDEQSDTNEWSNVAYREENKEVVRRHREVLRERIPGLTWEGEPEGYEVTEEGSIRKTDFVRMRNYDHPSVNR